MIHIATRTERTRRRTFGAALAFGLALLTAQSAASDGSARPASEPAPVDLTKECKAREGWSDPAPPVRIFGNSWYVGTCGVAAVLVTSDKGHVLIDGGPGAAAPLVAANIEKLGFRLQDVRWIMSSHEHFDHVGALAELKQLTGAKVAALAAAAPVLTSGKANPDDPQFHGLEGFAPIAVDRVLRDGEIIRVGPLRITVRATPAHAPGSASWTWSSCAGASCRTVAYADSTTLISDEGYRFTDRPARAAQAREGLRRIEALPCDILVTPHPGASNLFARMAGQSPLVDPQACQRHARNGEELFAKRLATEASSTAP